MDNRIFNVNGKSDEMLLLALQLAFLQEGEKTLARAWSFCKDHGLILHWWYNETWADRDINSIIRFPGNLTAIECLPFISSWLKGEDAEKVATTGWDADSDHDGHNSLGWRVYCGDWGHVNGHSNAICAIKPAYMWHGK